MRAWIPILATAALLAGGCAEPVLDTADLEGSIANLRDSVDASTRVRFDEAIALVREASGGKVSGTKAFPLAGMTAGAVLAEAERIEIRRDRALEQQAIDDYQALLDTEKQLAR